MANEFMKQFAQVFVYVISAAFVLAVIRFVFYFGSFVRRQEEMGGQIAEAGTQFKEFATSVRETLASHGRDILEMQVELRLRKELENRGINPARRNDPPADMRP